jgi:hypothetical protein
MYCSTSRERAWSNSCDSTSKDSNVTRVKLCGLHLRATEKVHLKHVVVAEEFMVTIAIEYAECVCDIMETTA